jgi:hypothetical protein
MDVAVLVTHEIKLAGRNRHWFGANAKEAADVDDHLRARTDTVNM